MQRLETRTGQLALVAGNRQERSDLVTVIEPTSPFAPEARKGKLYLVTEANETLPGGAQACQLVATAVRRAFYDDTSFSVTAALRAAVRAANKALYEQNFNLAPDQRTHVGLSCAVLRDSDLFLAQVQPAQAYVLTEGRLRALPAHPSWDPAHVSAAPFARAGALGASLFIEPELYRSTLRAGDGAILCSANFAHLLGRAEIDAALRQNEPTPALERLQQVAGVHGLSNAHALALMLMPAGSPAAHASPDSATTSSARGRQFSQTVSDWFVSVASGVGRRRPRPRPAPRPAQPDPLRTIPAQPTLSANPIPRPAPLDVGESLSERYEQARRAQANRAPLRHENLPPSAFLGENLNPGPVTRRVDLSDPELLTPPKPYRPRYEARPLVDLSWRERLALPFQRLALALEGNWRKRRGRRGAPVAPRPISRGHGLSYRRSRPPFPWALLTGLILVVGALIFYGLALTQQNDQQLAIEYFTAAEGRLAAVRQAPDETAALEALELARQAIDEVRASPYVTDTNPGLWLRFQELWREYERAMAAIQHLTFFDHPTLLAQHPVPNGTFASVVAPQPISNVTDTVLLEGLRYIYAIDSDPQNARLYRIPRDGGVPQPYLSPGQGVGTTVVGPIRSALWRIDQVVAIDEAPNGFGYYFHSGDSWNYSKLGASEIWSLQHRLDVEEYGGNLYVWGAQPNEVLRFPSGRYGDTPDYWLDPVGLQNLDLTTVVDMGVDGNIYLLRANSTIMVFSDGKLVSELTPEAISPPVTAVTSFFVTGATAQEGFFFLVDTLNQRIIQVDKRTGKVIQQVKVRPDEQVSLKQLAGLFVDSSGPRALLYMVNAGQIIRAELPAPPRSFRDTTPVTTPAPGPTLTPRP